MTRLDRNLGLRMLERVAPGQRVGWPSVPGLLHAGLVGIAGFVLLAAAGAVILNADWLLRGLGHAVPERAQ